ncbi:MAG: transcription antitermination factor NusB [Endomicrobiia bacterium]
MRIIKREKPVLTFRRQSRILALNVLYLIDICNLNINQAINFVFSEEKNYPEPIKKYSSFLVIATIQNLSLIDNIIKKNLKNWSLERLTAVDRCILRLASCEFLCCPETPIKVILNEAIEIAKTYSTKDSGRFVNGVLDKIKYIREDKTITSKFIEPENAKECKKLAVQQELMEKNL